MGGSTTATGSGAIAPVIASLPASLRWEGAGNEVSADLVVLDGGLGWPQSALDAIPHGVRGLMLVRPTPVTPDEVPQLPVPVVIDHRFASNPAVASTAHHFDSWPAEALVEVSALIAEPADAERLLLDQLATLRRLGLPPVILERLTWSPSGYHLRGTASSGAPLLLSAHVTTGAPPHLRVRGLAPEVAVELSVPDPGTARPAVIVRTTQDGATTEPTLWESSHRAAWRRLHTAVVDGIATDDLADLRADLEVAGHVLPPP